MKSFISDLSFLSLSSKDIFECRIVIFNLSSKIQSFVLFDSTFNITTIGQFIDDIYSNALQIKNEGSNYKNLDNTIRIVLAYENNEIPNGRVLHIDLKRSFGKEKRDEVIKILECVKQIQIEDA